MARAVRAARSLVCASLAWALGGCAGEAREATDLSASCEEVAGEGTLLMLDELGPPLISTRDLASGHEGVAFQSPSQGFIYEFDARDEGVAMAWTPPPEGGDEPYDRSVLALLQDGEAVAVTEGVSGAWAFYPAWAADGASLWFVASGEGTEPNSMLSRVELASGAVEAVVPNVTEPAVSPDGQHLAWVAVNPFTAERTLVLADADAAAPEVVAEGAEIGDLGQPFFSADGQSLYFIVLEQVAAPEPSILDLLVPSAVAHSSHAQPGDWWRVPVQGGDPEQVSFLGTIQYDGAADGDGFVSATREGAVRIAPSDGSAVALRCARTVRAVGME